MLTYVFNFEWSGEWPDLSESIISLGVGIIIGIIFYHLSDFGSCIDCQKLTYGKNEDEKGNYFCCDSCTSNKTQKKLNSEKVIPCPHCCKEMKKEIISDERIIIDRCDKHGVFLDKGELEKLREVIEYSSSSGDFSTGFLLGMTIN
jgi:hypothetical protein